MLKTLSHCPTTTRWKAASTLFSLMKSSFKINKNLSYVSKKQEYLHLVTLIEQQQSRLKNTPELGPTFQRPSNFQPLGDDNYWRVFQSTQKFLCSTLLLWTIVFLLFLNYTNNSKQTVKQTLQNYTVHFLPDQWGLILGQQRTGQLNKKHEDIQLYVCILYKVLVHDLHWWHD